MSSNVMQFCFRSAPQRDWSQQELAEFYRVEAVLLQSGIDLETERGVSDEGDPWFVFCRTQTADVIVHFARYDNEYIASVGSVDHVLRGRSIREIIDTFMGRQPLVMSRPTSAPTKLFLHPAALLSAFVATAFFLDASYDAEAGTLESHETAPLDAAPQWRIPAAFEALIEASGLTGNRELWVALGIVAIAFSIETLDIDYVVGGQKVSFFSDDMVLASAAEVEATMRDALPDVADLPLQIAQSRYRSGDLDNQGAVIEGTLEPRSEEATDKWTFIKSENADADSDFSDFSASTSSIDKATFRANQDTQNSAPTVSALRDDTVYQLTATQEQQDDSSSTARQLDVIENRSNVLVLESATFDHHQVATSSLTPALMNVLSSGTSIPFQAAGASMSDTSFSPAFEIDFIEDRTQGETTLVFHARSGDADPETSEAIDTLDWFTAQYPEFMILTLGRDVVVFDWAHIDLTAAALDVHTWTLQDGSTMNIIGSLPEGLVF